MRVKGFGAMGYPFQNAHVNLANCLVNLQTWPSTGTVVPNETPSYPTYDASCAANRYVLQSTGASSSVFSANTDYILMPGQTAPVQNIQNISFELGIYLSTVSNSQYLLGKGHWFLVTEATNALALLRYDANTTSWIKWQTPNGSFTAANFYDIQFTQALGVFGTAPVIMINGISQTLTPTNYQSATTYESDAGNDFIIGNAWGGATAAMSITVYFARLYNAILSNATLLNNWYADRWRFGQVF